MIAASSDPHRQVRSVLRRRVAAFALMVAGPLAALVLFLSLADAWWLKPLLYVWTAASTVAFLVAYESRCPRCKKRFFGSRWWTSFFAKSCRYCGLSISDDSPRSERKGDPG